MDSRGPLSSQAAHQHKLTNRLNQQRNLNILCDVTVVIDNRSFLAHRAVLAASSDYFHAMFTSGFREATQDTVFIQGKSEIFDILLEFIYTGKLNFSLEIVFEILQMACYLQLQHASEGCAAYLIRAFSAQKIKFKEALQIASLTEWHPGFSELNEWCNHCIAENFSKIQDVAEYKQLVNVEMMSRILERSDLAADEDEILVAVLSWLKHDLEYRNIHARNLLQKVRLGVIPADRLVDIIMKELPELLSLPDCDMLLERILTRQDVDEYKDIFTTRTTINVFLIPDNQTYYLDDQAPGNHFGTRPKWKRLSRFAPVPLRKLYCHNTLVVDEQLYLAGGVQYREPHSDSSDDESNFRPLSICQKGVFRYTAKENRWQKLKDMKVPRCQFSLVHHNGYIYAIGGGWADDLVTDVECYSIANKEWENLPPLAKEVYLGKSSAVAFRGKILVYAAVSWTMNGSMTPETHHLQAFDPETQSWNVLLTEKHNQGSFPTALVVYDRKCYRVVYGNCSCRSKDFGCKWHKVRVHELLLTEENSTMLAKIGEVHDQSDIPEDQTVGAFCIKDDVFVTVNGYIHKTGNKINRRQSTDLNLAKWEWSSTIGFENSVVRFTIDKAVLE